jgi:hypothetical protein
MEESIDYICDDSGCNNDRLCCYICQEESQKSHSMKNIKMIVGKIMQIIV